MDGEAQRGTLVEVAVPLPLPTALTYAVPRTLDPFVRVGARVRVPVGRRTVTGLVWRRVAAAPAGVEPRDLSGLVDLEPVLPPELLDLARFAAEYYLAPLGEVLAAMVPQDLPGWGERRVALTDAGALAQPRDACERAVRDVLLERGKAALSDLLCEVGAPELAPCVERLAAEGRLSFGDREGRGSRYLTAVELASGDLEGLRGRCGRSNPARRVVDFLAAASRPATLEELRGECGASPAVLRRLAKLGVVRVFTQAQRLDLARHLLLPGEETSAVLELRPDQDLAVTAVSAAVQAGGYAAFLLQGMTGSGKTEVYLRAADAALARGRAVLLLVPEIALVPALARAAADRFGDRSAVLHSGLGAAERHQEWERVRKGEARVVVGPRSALFAPVANLGLVVVDEEQDLAYKQEVSPRYHGRDLALVRCRSVGAVAVLASATPSLEARYAATKGRLRALTLVERAGGSRLPEGLLVDLRQEASSSGRPGELLFSRLLVDELKAALAAGDQALLLRNRRGYAPLLLCRACGEDFRCPDCGLARTYHRRARRLICHYCGSAVAAPAHCPACRAEALEPLGAGTERVEEELSKLLPEAHVDVLDRDSTRRVGGAAAILERFRRGDVQVLVGTQMLSKGHHFPRVALTAVLSADAYLGFPDFRAVERTYVLLTQLAGRAGRGVRPGRVVLQTWRPEHYAIQAALRHDDAAFAAQEMRFREMFDYPPFTRMALLLTKDRHRERALGRLREVAARLQEHAHGPAGLRVTGPAPAPLERLRGEWRFQCLVRGTSGAAVRRAVASALADRPTGEVVVDIDPYQLL